MANVSKAPWGSVSESDYTPEQYCSAALVDMNPSGQAKTKAMCHLPVREPDGTLNAGGVHAAAAALAGARGGVSIPPDQKRAAAKMLLRHYSMMGEQPPDSLRRLAG